MVHRVSVLGLLLVTATSMIACSSSEPPPPPPMDKVHVDRVDIVRGVPDRGANPAVVALTVGEARVCSGALVTPWIVVTTRRCVSEVAEPIHCPADRPQVHEPFPAESIGIYVGDALQGGAPRTRARDVIVPYGVTLCDADVAFVVTHDPVQDVKPLALSMRGAATGEFVRTVGFGRLPEGGPVGVKLVRDHVRVTATSRWEFLVSEAACQDETGGPALDEDTGEVVGVLSRTGPECQGPNVHNVYTRTDAYFGLFDEAIRRASQPKPPSNDPLDAGKGDADAGKLIDAGTGKKSGKKTPPDMGVDCEKGEDCAAGVCVSAHDRRYCSRTCGPNERCPNTYHCMKSEEGPLVCVHQG